MIVLWEVDTFYLPLFYYEVFKMNEKNYKKKLEFQEKLIKRQSEEIESLNCEIHNLRLKLEEKDNIINSIGPLRNELSQNVAYIKEKKEEYQTLINELRKMKEIINQDVYGGRWRLIKFLMK